MGTSFTWSCHEVYSHVIQVYLGVYPCRLIIFEPRDLLQIGLKL